MAAVVNNIPNPEFTPPEIVTVSGSIVQRRRVKLPCNAPGSYSHNAQTSKPYVVQFDIWDGESFVDLKSLRYNATFTSSFYRWVNSLSSVVAGTPGAADIPYSPGTGPCVDSGIQSLVARLRVGNSQGFVIEDISQFGIFGAILDKCRETMSMQETHVSNLHSYSQPAYAVKQAHQGYLHSNFVSNSILTEESSTYVQDGTNYGISSVSVNKTPDRDLQIRFEASSFLNSVRYLPIFLLRNGLRLEIELENPLLAFYHQYAGGVPEFLCSTNSAVWTSFTQATGVFVPAALSIGVGALPESNATFQWNRISVGDVLLGYKDGVLVAYGAVSAVTVGAQATQSFTSVGFASMIPAGITSATLSSVCDQLWYITAPRAQSFVQGANAGAGYATTICPASTSAAGANNTIVQGASSGAGVAGVYWNYACSNNELLIDYVKPSTEVFTDYLNRFNSPVGIPYAFTRVLYFSKALSGSVSGTQQISIPVAVRSLKGFLIVISDPLSASTGNDATIYNFPSKSSFMMRGLTDAQLQIGGQLFPSYKMKFDNQNVLQNLPELEAMLSLNGERSSPPYEQFKNAKDYMLCCGEPMTRSANLLLSAASSYMLDCSAGYRDTSSFVLGISTMRKDGDFASGVDCSQAGSVTLNLSFSSTAPGQGAARSRDRLVHIYALADAVVTFQRDANGIRY